MQAGRKRLASRMPAAWPALLAGGALLLAAFAPTAQGQQAAAPKLSGPAERAAAAQPPSLGLSLPAPAEAALPPLRPDELERLRPRANGPALIGVHRQLPDTVQLVSTDPTGNIVNKTKAVKQADALHSAQQKAARAAGRKAAVNMVMPWTAAAQHVRTFVPGAWQATVAGRVWRLQITSPGARSLRLHFKNFNVGKGLVWLHNSRGQVYGPYTGQGLFGDGDFWSDSAPGDRLTIEYQPDPMQADAALAKAVPFRVRRISHRVGGGPRQKAYLGGSLSQKAAELPEKQTDVSCSPNVNCYYAHDRSLEQGVHTDQLSRGVASISFETEEGLADCSGVAINHKDSNRAEYDPAVHGDTILFLTAAHCIGTTAVARSAVVFWRHEAWCGRWYGQAEFFGPKYNSITSGGGAVLVSTGGSFQSDPGSVGDISLLEISGPPPEAEVVLQGWDAGSHTGMPTKKAVGIHHPRGAYKVISIGRRRAHIEPRVGPAYMAVSWYDGKTEPGSSGSPIFAEGKVFGILGGGLGGRFLCDNTDAAYYSKFNQFYERHAKEYFEGEVTIQPEISREGVVLATGDSLPRPSRGIYRLYPEKYPGIVSPGAMISIYGQHFAPPGVQAGAQLDDAGRVATELAGVVIKFDGWFTQMPLFFVSPTQINAQVPYYSGSNGKPFDGSPGNGGRADIVVFRNYDQYNQRDSHNASSSYTNDGGQYFLVLEPTTPGFFYFPGTSAIAAQHGGGPDLVGPVDLLPNVNTSPARENEIITVYGTGFGLTDPPLKAGQIPGKAFNLVHKVGFRLGDVDVPDENILYAGAAPCCAGLYQFTLRIPANSPKGNVPIVATANGVSSPEGPYIAIAGGQR